MKWYAAALLLFLPAMAIGGEALKTGIVKGAITMGGIPTSDAVVSVEGLPEHFLESLPRVKAGPAVMDQQDMKFVPRVLAILVETTVEFANNDKTFHNVFSASEAKKFDLGLYSPGRRRNVTFDRPGLVRILCNVHPHMEAFIVVKAHPYFSATDGRGHYRISNVPLGKAHLEIWHPDFGTRKQAIDLVAGGEVLNLDFDLKKR
jgi:plastocyanin